MSPRPGSVYICEHDCEPLQGQGTKKMRKMRKVGGDDGTGNACRVNPAAKDAFHETSSPKKQSRGTQTPTTIADEFAVESRPTVQTYTKISFDVSINSAVGPALTSGCMFSQIYGCSHCGQKIIARDRSTHRWHCGKAKAATRCDLCGHVSVLVSPMSVSTDRSGCDIVPTGAGKAVSSSTRNRRYAGRSAWTMRGRWPNSGLRFREG